MTQEPDNVNPTARIAAALLFRSKATVLQMRRAAREFSINQAKQAPFGDRLLGHPVIAESRTPLRTTDDDQETLFVSGKIQNLRVATSKLNGVEVRAGDVFSFWKQLGRTNRRKGYVPGRELREGCLILTIGGGLCQLSNALYDTALQADLQIVERHAHSRVVPGSLAEIGVSVTSDRLRVAVMRDAPHTWLMNFGPSLTATSVRRNWQRTSSAFQWTESDLVK